MVLVLGISFLYLLEKSLKPGIINLFAKQTNFMASTISSSLENHLLKEDRGYLKKALTRVLNKDSDIRFIFLQNRKGDEIVSVFSANVSEIFFSTDLRSMNALFQKKVHEFFGELHEMELSAENTFFLPLQLNTNGDINGRKILLKNYFIFSEKRETYYYEFAHEDIFLAVVPIQGGNGGKFMLGLSGKSMQEKLIKIRKPFIFSLILCLLIGIGISHFASKRLSKPIQEIMAAAQQIEKGNFRKRANVYYQDEIGKLATAFNHMTESLEKYQKEVGIKETQCGLLIDKLIKAQEEERKAISRELHDQLSQSLSALLLQVNSMNHSRLKGVTSNKELLQKMENEIKNIIDDVRRLAWSMRPSILDDYGLDSALARHVDEIRNLYNTKVDYQFESFSTARLPGNIEISLYRIAQEALKNAIRHSKASQISLVLIRKNEDITLLIEDNGEGIKKNDQDVAANNGSLGLIGMRERANLIGGSFIIESSSSKGTTIQVKIPLGLE
jgi:signal transduction histidine kinase